MFWLCCARLESGRTTKHYRGEDTENLCGMREPGRSCFSLFALNVRNVRNKGNKGNKGGAYPDSAWSAANWRERAERLGNDKKVRGKRGKRGKPPCRSIFLCSWSS